MQPGPYPCRMSKQEGEEVKHHVVPGCNLGITKSSVVKSILIDS